MAIRDINNLAIYFDKEVYSLDKKGPLPFPVIVILDLSGKVLAAIKFGYKDDFWHIINAVADDGYGPTIYRVLMQLSGESGLAPTLRPDYQIKELIVDKSKKIWFNFFKNNEIKHTSIRSYYKDTYLNNKFIVESNFLDINQSIENFDLLIDKRFNENFRNKTLQKIKDKFIPYPEEEKNKLKYEFTEKFKFMMLSDVSKFLEASQAAHQ